jgi:23S rRNA (uracil1939-C5)-methyltransferase
MRPAAYLDWKREQVRLAFAARGVDADVAPVMAIDPGTRRRAVLAALRTSDGVELGFHGVRDHAVVAISECPVLSPVIVRQLPALASLLEVLLMRKKEARVTLTASQTGLAVDIAGGARELGQVVRTEAGRLASLHGFARVTVDGEMLVANAEPVEVLSGVRIALPPAAFLQATRQSEAALTSLVLAAVGDAHQVADLFAGLGTFTFALAAKARVQAVENDADALAAMAAALRLAQGLKPVTMLRRDLLRDPLAGKELVKLDALVFDPPRAGAPRQAQALAASKVPRIVAVSCNPATLARDARTLIDGGYRLVLVQPVDQFLFSPHIEVVASFARDRR